MCTAGGTNAKPGALGGGGGAAGPTPLRSEARLPPIWGNGFSRFKKQTQTEVDEARMC